MIILQYCI